MNTQNSSKRKASNRKKNSRSNKTRQQQARTRQARQRQISRYLDEKSLVRISQSIFSMYYSGFPKLDSVLRRKHRLPK